MKSETGQILRSRTGREFPFIDPSHSFGYVKTLKVGTNTMTTVLQKMGWKKYIEPDIKYIKLFGMVRHPFSRWVSGTAQFWAGYYTEPPGDRERLYLEMLRHGDIKWFITEGSHDQHTQPQAWNFDPYPNIKLFKFETLNKVWDWLNIEDPKVHIRNHNNMGLQGEMRKLIKQRALPHKDLILDIYEEDLRLWENAI